MVGNCVPGVLAIIWTIFEGKQHFRRILSSLANWRVLPRWYFLAIVLPCGVYLVALDVVLLLFPEQHTFPLVRESFKNLLLNLPFAPLWEEIAWRAYALRKLETRYSRFASALFLGIYWAVWHVPLWLLTSFVDQHNTIPVLSAAIINVVAWSFIFSFLYGRSSRSLPVVILLHAIYAAASSQAYAVIANRGLYLVVISAIFSVFIAIALAGRLRSDSSGFEAPSSNQESAVPSN